MLYIATLKEYNMNKPDATLTKICSSCGQRKPLSAFLQLAGAHGYGNICSACRKTALENPVKDQEDSTRSTTGEKLDLKLLQQRTTDEREAFKETEDEYFDEREKKEIKKVERKEKIIHAADKAKKHRGMFDKPPSQDSSAKNAAAPVFGGEAHKAAAGKIDLATGPVESTRVAGMVKTQSAIYQSFKTWLGSAAPIVGAAGAAKQKQAGKPAPGAPAPDAVSEFVHRNSGPKSR